jgi:hypothetical protein
MTVRKELRPVHDALSCDVCGRTMLKGERTEPYIAPGGQRGSVCELCFGRAENAGWIRESAASQLPARPPREEQRRSLLSRLRRRGGDEPERPADAGSPAREHAAPEPEGEDPPAADDPLVAAPRARPRPKDPRHVRAVPTTAEVKVERALELFNESDHQRTIAGLRRSLGEPWVGARPDEGETGSVSVVVAWELSWYRYRVDLGDEGQPVMLLDKGDEIGQIPDHLREWNAALDPEDRVLSMHAVAEGGPQG